MNLPLARRPFARAPLLTLVPLIPLLSPGPAHAQPGGRPLVTDRPDFTESPVTVAPGRVQLEGGYTFARRGGLRTHTVGELLLRVGLLPRAELRLALNSFQRAEADGAVDDGLTDTEIGAKLVLLQPRPGQGRAVPQLALLLGTSLPTGGGAFGEDALQPTAKLAAAWSPTTGMGLGANLNGTWASEAGERFSEFSGSVSLGFELAPRLGAYAELFGFVVEARPDSGFGNGGLTYRVGANFQFDVRAGYGLTGRDRDYFVGAGFAWRR